MSEDDELVDGGLLPDDLLDRLERWYPVPALGVVLAFMAWVRIQAFDVFLVDGQVYYNGNDAYYHFREVMYVVTHWPWTMPFDPWTYFPYGTEQGQFGTLFDQIIGTAAIVVGLGSPSEHTVALVHLVAPVAFGALTALPAYGIGKRLRGRPAGVTAAVLLALIPGTFLSRTTVGFPDHNSAEPLFQAAALLATMVAIGVVEREKPVAEQLLDRDWAGLRTPGLWSVLAGVTIALYVWVWPPAIFFVGLLGIFFTVALVHDFYRGRSPEHLAFVGAVSMAVLFLFLLVRLQSFNVGTTSISLLHLFLAAGVGVGCVFLAALARAWERRDLSRVSYPATVLLLIAVGLAGLATVLPRVFNAIYSNVLRIFAFGQSDTVLTIAEAQSVPLGSLSSFMMLQYGLLYLLAPIGLLLLLWHVYRSEAYSAQELLVAVWAVATGMMALTQVRFNYYLATAVAVLSAVFLWKVLDLVDLHTLQDVRRIETYQALILLAVLVVVVAPLTPFVAGESVVERGRSTGPGSSVEWGAGLNWLETNSPPEGRYGGATNEMAYYGTYERTGDFAYPEGAYGVMSWWDYGHWITVLGERIPDANPFQQGPQAASAFFQASNETRANLLLDALSSDRSAYTRSTDELRTIVAEQSAQQAHEDTRYVVIDDQMAGGKFAAIATWTGPGSGAYFDRRRYQLRGQNVSIPGTNQRYDDTMLARLYFDDASGLSHYRLVHEIDRYSLVGGYVEGQRLDPLRRIQLNGNWDSLGGTAQQLRTAKRAGQPVQIGPQSYVYRAEIESRVKLYERVEGATITGSAPTADNGTTVLAFLQLQTGDGRNVTYVQDTATDADGSFSMTVPYATDNAVGPAEGGTNVSVRATSNYTVLVGGIISPVATGNLEVPEEALYEGRQIQVDLETPDTGSGGNGSAGNGSAGSLAAPQSVAPPAP